MNRRERGNIEKKIKSILLKESRIVFAYLTGSFLDNTPFRDIDIMVLTGRIREDKVLDYEAELADKLAETTGIVFDKIDVRVINHAPLYFKANVFSKGKLLFTRNKKLLVDMIEGASLFAVANEFTIDQSLKELAKG